MTAPLPATQTRLYVNGSVIAEDFGVERAVGLLAEHPDAVLWLDLCDPDEDGLATVAAEFHLHALAVEDALQHHERPKLDRYPEHLFLNVYAVKLTFGPEQADLEKVEISAFVTDRALITVRKTRDDTIRFVERWDADAELAAAGGVAFLLYGLLDTVVDGHLAAARELDVAMDDVEDALIGDGGAPRPVRRHALQLRRTVALLRRAVTPMPDVVAEAMRTDLGLADGHLAPYYRDVADHARHTADQVDHLRDRVEGMLQADLSEQSNVLNDTTRKLAAWAAVIAVPTALTGYFGQNLPYPGFGKASGYVQSMALLILSAGGLYLYLKKRRWL